MAESKKPAGDDHPYEIERRTEHLVRPDFRITELTLSPAQQIPWHCHSHVRDTAYVVAGEIRLFLREPKEEVRLGPGDTYSIAAERPHLVLNGGSTSATFFLLQGMGEYDFVRLA
ncbi:MAG TPA: cupin domain-containing protein [Verrucomicrobiae bacterium]|jgi:quercetin dioxygenase-like cupin family protein|nr:cupin domain-containing protein [Verrucomicrobiae bacterium]